MHKNHHQQPSQQDVLRWPENPVSLLKLRERRDITITHDPIEK